ncbi:MAG TPA: hypothetical protein VHE99_04520 [Gammaproteobacteria bacterium]|nr:hypothetical protein [Gammaproteobacteria bacterium]
MQRMLPNSKPEPKFKPFNPKDPSTLPIYEGPSVRVLFEDIRNPTVRYDLVTEKDIFFSDSMYRREARKEVKKKNQSYVSPARHTLYNEPLYGFSGCMNLRDAYSYGKSKTPQSGRLTLYAGIRPVEDKDTSRYKVFANKYIELDRGGDYGNGVALRRFLHLNANPFSYENEIYHLYAHNGEILEKPLNGTMMNYSELVDWAISSEEIEKALRGELVRNYFDNQPINVTLWEEIHNKKSRQNEYKAGYKKFSIFHNSRQPDHPPQTIVDQTLVKKDDLRQIPTPVTGRSFSS